MTRIFPWVWRSCLLLILAAFPPWVLASEVRLVRSGDVGVTLEMTVSDFHLDLKRIGSAQYDQVVISDLGQSKEAGKPQVPIRGALIGIPGQGEVTLKVTGSDRQVVHLRKDLAPATPSAVSTNPSPPDADIYKKNSFYPGPLAVKGFTGYMRDQKVMQILFYPVQYNPVTGEVHVYKRIEAEVSFASPLHPFPAGIPRKEMRKNRDRSAAPSEAYEKLLQDSLLNYGALQR